MNRSTIEQTMHHMKRSSLGHVSVACVDSESSSEDEIGERYDDAAFDDHFYHRASGRPTTEQAEIGLDLSGCEDGSCKSEHATSQLNAEYRGSSRSSKAKIRPPSYRSRQKGRHSLGAVNLLGDGAGGGGGGGGDVMHYDYPLLGLAVGQCGDGLLPSSSVGTHYLPAGLTANNYDHHENLDFCCRNRLYDLFGLIEKEFENLYAENYALRCKVGDLSDQLANGESGALAAADILSEIEHVTLVEKPAHTAGSKKGASHVGQKLKTAFKVPPGRLVSSFKAGVGVNSAQDALRVRYVRPFLGHRDGVWDIGVSPHSTNPILGSASADQTARFWCIETGACVAHYTGHSGSVNSVRFSPTENRAGEIMCVTAGGDRVAHVFSISIPAPSGVGGQTCATAGTVAPLGNPGSGGGCNKTPLTVVQQQQSAGNVGGGGCGTVPTLPAGQFAAQVSEDEADRDAGTVDTDRDDGANDDSLIMVRSPSVELTGHSGVVIAADWLCSGDQVITASWDRTANIYDVERGEILNVLCGHDQELTHASAHSSQKLVVTSSKDFTFRLWDFRDPIHSVSVFQGHTEAVTSSVFSSSDKVVSGSDDRTVKVWDLKNMRSALTTLRFDAPINRLSISAKHNVIAIPHDNRQVRLFDLSGTRMARLPRTNRRGHRRMVCGTAWADAYPAANLFTCGFDNMVLGWKYYHVTDTAKKGEKEKE